MFPARTGGIHLEYHKEPTEGKPTEPTPHPRKVVIPLIQHTGAPCQPLVKVGDHVKLGAKIGEAQKYISSPVHSSVSGRVAAIENYPHPTLGTSLAVVVESDGLDEKDPSFQNRAQPLDLSAEGIREIVKEAGIVGLGGAAFPTHVKLAPPKGKEIDTFILNGAECEPYLTCDHRLMLEKTPEILQGMKFMMRTLGAKAGFIAIERNKPDAIAAMRQALEPEATVKIVSLKTKYPMGAERSLIKFILGREVPSGGLPIDVGVVVHNVGTACAVYEALYLGKPLYERVVTVTGAVRQPKNLLARIGTPAKDLIQACGGFDGKPGKVILGGPMMGLAQYTDEVPIIKGTSGILVLTGAEVRPEEWLPCIRCTRCVDSCPADLLPSTLSIAVERERFDLAKEYDVSDCIECGACAYVCPAKRPMVHMFKYAKDQLSRR